MAVQALGAAVAVGKRAICPIAPVVKPAQPAGRGTAPLAPAPEGTGDTASETLVSAATPAHSDTQVPATQRAAAAAKPLDPRTTRLMQCCLALGAQGICVVQGAAHAAAPASSTTRAVLAAAAQRQASFQQARGLLVTAAAGLAWLTAAIATLAGQQSAASRGAPAEQPPEVLLLLLRQSAALAVRAWAFAAHLPEFAADLIEVCTSMLGITLGAQSNRRYEAGALHFAAPACARLPGKSRMFTHMHGSA